MPATKLTIFPSLPARRGNLCYNIRIPRGCGRRVLSDATRGDSPENGQVGRECRIENVECKIAVSLRDLPSF